ncbi:MAG: single-stranded DNA-binding protein [Firmicutes bacterium]|nr:single-stranded DNA-binding protein [Bacillota bacterium]MBR1737711.1 single-stranded DNA-binding protein [Bacillota bacterium]
MRAEITEIYGKYGFDEKYNKFEVNLPHSGRKENKVNVLVQCNYPYQPEVGDVVEITGTVTTYDEKEAGLQTYIVVISLFKSSFDSFDLKNNTVSVTGRVFRKDKLGFTASGTAVQRVSVSINTEGRYVPVHCIGHNTAAEALNGLELNEIAEISGRLVSREFLYREDKKRVTTELIVDYVYPIRA